MACSSCSVDPSRNHEREGEAGRDTVQVLEDHGMAIGVPWPVTPQAPMLCGEEEAVVCGEGEG